MWTRHGHEADGRTSDEVLGCAFLARNGSKIPRTRRRDFGNGANRYYYANNALSDVMATFSRGRPGEARNERNYARNAQSVGKPTPESAANLRISSARARFHREKIDPLSRSTVMRAGSMIKTE